MLFFFNDTATTEIYTLSLHDALPISRATRDPGRIETCEVKSMHLRRALAGMALLAVLIALPFRFSGGLLDRKSTRLNSSHANISYAVFCLKKKKYISM